MKYLVVVDMQNDFITVNSGSGGCFLLCRSDAGKPSECPDCHENVPGGGKKL